MPHEGPYRSQGWGSRDDYAGLPPGDDASARLNNDGNNIWRYFMKVQTGIQAGITPGDVVDQASNAVASAAHTVSGVASDVLHGAGDLSNNLGITDLAKKLWYWPFNTPGTPSA